MLISCSCGRFVRMDLQSTKDKLEKTNHKSPIIYRSQKGKQNVDAVSFC